jgi:uncharacterized protein YbaP (TraB family)
MKRFLLWSLAGVLSVTGFTQTTKTDNTLLWRISGNGLVTPSYLFGTIHMICADDIELSDSLRSAIRRADKVYLELDMDNLFEMMSVMTKMKMNDDTTLADLLTPAEYQTVKAHFNKQKGVLPFSMLETFKPMLSASTLMQGDLDCENAQAMEQLVMKEAKYHSKSVKGLETMSFQMSIFDSIPYTLQAKQLLRYVENFGKNEEQNEFAEMMQAYRNQELSKLEAITKKEDGGMEGFTQILLYNRNKDWVEKLQTMMPTQSLVVAVGAGHLPGNQGVIDLLRKKGYKVEPVKNNMIKTNTKEL